jgi:uncharacterized protein (DUF433 family)
VDILIDFDEEVKKFYPSLEVADVQEAIYNQELVDAADIFIRMIKDDNKDD